MNQTSMTLGSMLIFQGVSVVIFQIFDANFFYAFAWFSNSQLSQKEWFDLDILIFQTVIWANYYNS